MIFRNRLNKAIHKFNCEIISNDIKLNNNTEISECFNSYFINIGTKLIMNNFNSKDPLSYINSFHSSSLYPTPTNHFEILKNIRNLKTSSPGYDDIHPKMIKQIFTFIVMPLSNIINCSLVSGVIPSKFKVAKVVPICIIIVLYQQDNNYANGYKG